MAPGRRRSTRRSPWLIHVTSLGSHRLMQRHWGRPRAWYALRTSSKQIRHAKAPWGYIEDGAVSVLRSGVALSNARWDVFAPDNLLSPPRSTIAFGSYISRRCGIRSTTSHGATLEFSLSCSAPTSGSTPKLADFTPYGPKPKGCSSHSPTTLS